MDVPKKDLNLNSLKSFIEEQVKRLEIDKATLPRFEDLKRSRSEGNNGGNMGTFNNSKVDGKMLSQTTNNNQAKPTNMVKNISAGRFLDSREVEKEKLIKSLSVPKTRYSCPSFEGVTQPSPYKLSPSGSAVNTREKEKDRLAAIFAASKPSHFCKVSKNSCNNFNGRICFGENQQLGLNKSNSESSKTETKEYFEESSRQKREIPEILVSEYREASKTKGSFFLKENTEDTAMVKIGEFSPLNPNNLGSRPELGIGEYGEERRKVMMDRRKQEYNEYLQQTRQQSRNTTPSRDSSPRNERMRTVGTQTEWIDDSASYRGEREISPRISTKTTFCPERDFHCESPSFGTSPVSKCFEGLSEKEIKELLYRQELKKQIEEKNRLKEQMRRREDEEEAKIEAKIQRDLEKIKRQYEEERLERLELAIRRKDQEDLLRQKLTDEQLKTLEESKFKKKQRLRDRSKSPSDKDSKKSTKNRHSSQYLPLSQSMPLSSASKAITEVNKMLRQPLLEVPNYRLPINTLNLSPPERDMHLKKVTALNQPTNISTKSSSLIITSPIMKRAKEVDSLVQKAVFEPSVKIGASSQTENDPLADLSQEAATKLKEVNRMLREPLMPQTDRVLLPVSPPLFDATIPPYMLSVQPPPPPPVSPPLPAFMRAQRSNCEILEDKWKVPHAGTIDDKSPDDVFTSHNRSVLTQLGAFRRHLQQERMRMQQRVRDDSP